jgi:hypothetical protein
MYPHQYLKFAAVLVPVALAFVMTSSGLDAAQTDGSHFKESIIVNNTAIPSMKMFSRGTDTR